jgi:hypothetical protein
MSFSSFSQNDQLKIRDSERSSNQNTQDAPDVVDEGERPSVDKYKLISIDHDTIHVDTTLTIDKLYRFNYLRRDDFELVPFHNVGLPYTQLTKNFTLESAFPDVGINAKRFNVLEAGDIKYYHVPTPLTELYFKTTFEQGQNVDAFFTTNFSRQFNMSIAYKGLRSLGYYQNALASTGNFRLTSSYKSKNNRYLLRTHFVSQDISNQENGGLTSTAVEQFEDQIPEFENRPSLAVRLENAESLYLNRRWFVDQSYAIKKSVDSLKTSAIKVHHRLNFSDHEYTYEQQSAAPTFGNTFEDESIKNNLEHQQIHNRLALTYSNKDIGELGVKAGHRYFTYGYDRLIQLENQTISNLLEGNVFYAGGHYRKKIKAFSLNASGEININGDYDGYMFEGESRYQVNDSISASAKIELSERAPNFNLQMYQSDYINYNWQSSFNNQETQRLSAQLNTNKYGVYSADITQIQNYTYFGYTPLQQADADVDSLPQPIQSGSGLRTLKLKARKDISLGNFTLANTLMYQKVTDGADFYNVPEFVSRNSLFYQDYWFRDALYLNTGLTFKYFSEFTADAYDPILGDFVVQNDISIGNFYTLDFFFNAKVKQARIFFVLENFPTIFNGNSNFSAPNYPYRDFRIRFGLVWNFFL